MTGKVSGIPFSKWANMEIDEFCKMLNGLSKFQKDSLAKHFRKFYEVLCD